MGSEHDGLTCTITLIDQAPPGIRTGSKLFVEIAADYDQSFVLFLKTIPGKDRQYEPLSKRWYTTIAHLEEVCEYAKAMYQRVWLIEDHGRVRRELVSGTKATQMEMFGGES